jgi:hypothetical protein
MVDSLIIISKKRKRRNTSLFFSRSILLHYHGSKQVIYFSLSLFLIHCKFLPWIPYRSKEKIIENILFLLVQTSKFNKRPLSHRKNSEVSRKSPEKSDDIPDRNTASIIRSFPLNSGRIRSVRFDLG